MNINVSVPQVPGYTPRQSQAAFNQTMAEAHAAADPRYNLKPLDRAGFSRGASQQHLAGISAAQNLAEGIAKAYSGQARDAAVNSGTALGNAQASEGLGLSTGAIAQQQQYANALAALQRQQNAMNMTQGILGGLLGNGGTSSNWLDNFLGY
jgi:hypothetical protein